MNPLRALLVSLSRIPPAFMLIAIIGLAVLATIVVNSELLKSEQMYSLQLKHLTDQRDLKARVVYVIQPIAEGETIVSSSLEERDISRDRSPVDALGSANLAVGRVAKYGIGQEQILSHRDLAPVGAAPGFESQLKPGMRAVTFAVDVNSGVAGFVNPQSRVDIMGMVGAGAETRVAAVLSDIEVIAVGQTYKKPIQGSAATPVSSVTVAVSPEDAQKLIKAVVASKLYLALRSDADHKPVVTMDVTALYGGPRPPSPAEPMASPEAPAAAAGQLAAVKAVPPTPMPDMHEIELWTGGKKETVSFQDR